METPYVLPPEAQRCIYCKEMEEIIHSLFAQIQLMQGQEAERLKREYAAKQAADGV